MIVFLLMTHTNYMSFSLHLLLWAKPPPASPVELHVVSSAVMHTDLSYSCDRDGHTVASVDFIALHVQSQSVQGNPADR